MKEKLTLLASTGWPVTVANFAVGVGTTSGTDLVAGKLSTALQIQ